MQSKRNLTPTRTMARKYPGVIIPSVQEGTLFVAHRGSMATAPENTLPAFQDAVIFGYSGIETDLKLTSDNEFVLIHDATVDGTTNGTGKVSEMTLAEIRALDAGSWFDPSYAGTKIPTFDEYLSLCRSSSVQPFIELKPSFTVAELEWAIQKIREHGMNAMTTFIAAWDVNLRRVRQADKRMNVTLIAGSQGLSDKVLQNAIEIGNCGVNAYYNDLLPDRVDLFRSNGIEIGLSANDTALEIEDAVNNIGVKTVTTGSYLAP
ncbi:glycerophosphodiester phosphodiesterase [Virgibacillus siamensis]|uniref:glycerophosphodiester phosphodiesterase n=1 Tax=Virgibacillus siamensis TaxID=480071 RepID=UPI000986B37B|nr:glycerophosphodiester phosphodiesterase family protein [Virgibacillus siamensis]